MTEAEPCSKSWVSVQTRVRSLEDLCSPLGPRGEQGQGLEMPLVVLGICPSLWREPCSAPRNLKHRFGDDNVTPRPRAGMFPGPN